MGIATPIIAAVAGAATSSAMAPKPPPLPVPPPVLQQPDGTAASNSVQQRAKAAFGAGATTFTGPQGLTDSANTAGKTLLGS